MKKKQGLLLPVSAICLTTLIWGVSFVSIKVAVEVLPPMSLAFSRFIIASLLLRLLLWKREPGFRLTRKNVFPLILSGLVGVTLYFFFENNGVKLISPSTSSIIIAGIPIVTVLVDTLLFGAPVTLPKIAGVVLSFAGVYLVVEHGLSMAGAPLLGYLFMFGAVLTWVIYNFLTRPLFGRYSQLAIVCYQTIFGTIAFIPMILFEIGTIEWSRVTPLIVLNVLYLGVLCSALGYSFYLYALKHLGVGTTTLFINLIPVVTVASSALMLRERISLKQVLGGLLVVLAVSLVSLRRVRRGESRKQRRSGTRS
ncbi:MAG TPA: DMT family transporter [Spirochaetia bacterium]|nr:DMT family transporter [Spirochaetia bacterium]